MNYATVDTFYARLESFLERRSLDQKFPRITPDTASTPIKMAEFLIDLKFQGFGESSQIVLLVEVLPSIGCNCRG